MSAILATCAYHGTVGTIEGYGQEGTTTLCQVCGVPTTPYTGPVGLEFQQAHDDPAVPRPWRVTANHEGFVTHGRADAHALLGFEMPRARGHIVVWTRDAIADPTRAVGLYPVYSAADSSGIFAITVPVTSAWQVTA